MPRPLGSKNIPKHLKKEKTRPRTDLERIMNDSDHLVNPNMVLAQINQRIQIAKKQFKAILEQKQHILTSDKLAHFVPNAFQKRVLETDSRFKICHAGNRIGKTTLGFKQIYDWKEKLKAEGVKDGIIWVSGLDYPNHVLQTLIPKFFELWKRSEIEKYDVREHYIKLLDGWTIFFKSAESGYEKYASARVDILWMDEEQNEDIFKEATMRLIDRNGYFLLTLTPTRGITWTYDKFYIPSIPNQIPKVRTVQIAEGKFGYLIQGSTWENATSNGGYIADQNIKEKEDSMSPEEKLVRIEGEFYSLGGFVLSNFDPKRNVVDYQAIPADWNRYIYWDSTGAGTKPDAVLFIAINPEGVAYVYDEIFEEFKLLEQLKEKIADKIGNSQTMGAYTDKLAFKGEQGQLNKAQLMAKGYNGVPFRQINDPSVEHTFDIVNDFFGLSNLVAGYKPRLLIMRNCVKTIYQVSHFKRGVRHIKGQVIVDEPEKVNSDLPSCLRMFVLSKRKYQSQIINFENLGRMDYRPIPGVGRLVRVK